jgi:nucleoside-diphosphate-sugar epimerase
VQILMLGGTGSIGAAVVSALVHRGHGVTALARSDAAARKLAAMGAVVLAGDIRMPEPWLAAVDRVDGVIHAATDFGADMAAMDQVLLDALLPRLAANARDQRLLYTGGCWLYGATEDTVATEQSPFDALPAFAWMVPAIHRVLATPGIRSTVIHPAMVYQGVEGVFARFAQDARALGRVRIVGHEATRWPLVHRHDLAALYVLALERSAPGQSYNAAAVGGLPVGVIARAIARHFGADETLVVRPVDAAAAELGEWARGYALDQQMSGDKARRDLGWHPVWHEPLADLPARD